jgi:hypothetical protein
LVTPAGYGPLPKARVTNRRVATSSRTLRHQNMSPDPSSGLTRQQKVSKATVTR